MRAGWDCRLTPTHLHRLDIQSLENTVSRIVSQTSQLNQDPTLSTEQVKRVPCVCVSVSVCVSVCVCVCVSMCCERCFLLMKCV